MPTRPILAGFLVLGAFQVAACEQSVSINFVNRQAFMPPAIYSMWWMEVETCSAVEGVMDRIQWYLADRIVSDSKDAVGHWRPPHDIILLTGRENDERVVKHEMLHDLLGGDANHQNEAWTRCRV